MRNYKAPHAEEIALEVVSVLLTSTDNEQTPGEDQLPINPRTTATEDIMYK